MADKKDKKLEENKKPVELYFPRKWYGESSLRTGCHIACVALYQSI
jgi:hypothetical protein